MLAGEKWIKPSRRCLASPVLASSQSVDTPFLPGILYSSSHISIKFHDINQDDEKGG
jgi:hypothetical protein